MEIKLKELLCNLVYLKQERNLLLELYWRILGNVIIQQQWILTSETKAQ